MNLNQIPRKGILGKEIRACFIPREGYKIVGGDYASFELAIIAELSNDPLWIDTLLKGDNLHSTLCSATFNIPVEDVEKPFPYEPASTYRDVQKTIDFG
jgi:DNA polymerase-1